MKNKTDIQTKNQQIDKILQEQYDAETKILESALLNVAGKTSWDEFPEESEEKIRAGYDRLITRLRETGDFNEAARAEKTYESRLDKMYPQISGIRASLSFLWARYSAGTSLLSVAKILLINPRGTIQI